MGTFNTSSGRGFILVGFSDWPLLELILLIYTLIFYILTLRQHYHHHSLKLDLQLHTLMYFILCHLSFLDLCYTMTTMPQLLINLQGHEQTITYGGFVAQPFVVVALGSVESMILVVIAFDHCATVCCPLHYMTIMYPCFCLSLHP
jgi:olfactory receptor